MPAIFFSPSKRPCERKRRVREGFCVSIRRPHRAFEWSRRVGERGGASVVRAKGESLFACPC
jgi:hypothetical protein